MPTYNESSLKKKIRGMVKGRRKKHGKLSAAKAREILHDGTVHGKAISKKQRGYFGAVASGTARY